MLAHLEHLPPPTPAMVVAAPVPLARPARHAATPSSRRSQLAVSTVRPPVAATAPTRVVVAAPAPARTVAVTQTRSPAPVPPPQAASAPRR